MKILSCDGCKILRHVSISAKQDQLHSILADCLKTCHPPVVQLKGGSSEMFVKKLLPNSTEPAVVHILRSNLPCQHFVEFKEVSGDLAFVAAVQPLTPQVKTFKDLLNPATLQRLSLSIIQSVLAQIVALLLCAQTFDSSFAHNDLKADNILLTAETSDKPLTIGMFQIQHQGVRVVLIDVETVTGSKFPTLDLTGITPDAQVSFGLSPNMTWCSWTDLHLVMMEVWTRLRKKPPPWFAKFETMLDECMPVRAFHTFEEGNQTMLSRNNRLSEKGRSAINCLLQTGRAKSLDEVLQLDFFNLCVSQVPLQSE